MEAPWWWSPQLPRGDQFACLPAVELGSGQHPSVAGNWSHVRMLSYRTSYPLRDLQAARQNGSRCLCVPAPMTLSFVRSHARDILDAILALPAGSKTPAVVDGKCLGILLALKPVEKKSNNKNHRMLDDHLLCCLIDAANENKKSIQAGLKVCHIPAFQKTLLLFSCRLGFAIF